LRLLIFCPSLQRDNIYIHGGSENVTVPFQQ